MIWKIFVFGFLALFSADVLGCLFNGGRITVPVSGGGKKPSLGAFIQRHTALNLFRAVVFGALVGLAHWWPQQVESPLLGCIFHVMMMVMLVWSTFWFLRHAKAWSHLLWFAILATAIILAAQHAGRVMSLWWDSRILSWVFCVLPWILFILVVGFAAFVLAWRFYKKTTGKGWKIVAVIIAILAITAMVFTIVFGSQITGLPSKPGTSSGAAAGNQTDTSKAKAPTPTESKQEQITKAVNNLTVQLVTPEELERLTVDKYSKISEELLMSSLTPHDESRTDKAGFSDALTYGFKSETDKGKFAELQEEILRNPVYGVTVANSLRGKKIGSKTIGDINPWMNTMCEKNAQSGVSGWCEYRDGSKTLYVTQEYRRYAASLCTFLERLLSQGVQARQTVENWCLNDTSEPNKRAGVLADYQYKKDALILAYVIKSQAGTNEGLLIVGFNVHDKRPEFYGEEDTPELPNAPSNPGTPNNPSNPDTPDNPDNPDTPTPTSTPTPETPTYNKDKSLSDNSGVNDDQGPGPDTNNGVGARGSSQDVNGGNGTPTNYAEEEQRHENDNAGQRTGNDDSTPSYSGGGTVDNNGDAANNPSSQGGYEPELPGGSGSGKQHWDGAGI